MSSLFLAVFIKKKRKKKLDFILCVTVYVTALVYSESSQNKTGVRLRFDDALNHFLKRHNQDPTDSFNKYSATKHSTVSLHT